MDTLPTTQGKTVHDAWDCRGCPAERSKTGGWTAASMILGPPKQYCYRFFNMSNYLLITPPFLLLYTHIYVVVSESFSGLSH